MSLKDKTVYVKIMRGRKRTYVQVKRQQKHKAEGENRKVVLICGKWLNTVIIVKIERCFLKQTLK